MVSGPLCLELPALETYKYLSELVLTWTEKVPCGATRGDLRGTEPGPPDYTGRNQTRDPGGPQISNWSPDLFSLELASRSR